MKVVFLEDVEGTALVGDVKEVKAGFARNFLLPRGMAIPATKNNIQRATSVASRETVRQAKLDAEARDVVGKLEGLAVTIEARLGENGRLFGSVTNRDIAARLAEAGHEVDAHIIQLSEPIREIGERVVAIRFTRNVSTDVTVTVVPDEASKPILERIEAEKKALEEAEAKRLAEMEYAANQARGRRRRRDEEDEDDDSDES
ncbi:MAG: 50S ribosomal protein L9 [Dehalococcoidia bacterium]|nr:50S ribosomal protein L9 [Dehalococcoidia bacterium]MCB9484757.1 50S ribosomal protein L9 [Thermoflexaceae bacterium]